MATRKSATEPIQDDVAVARLAKAAMAMRDGPAEVEETPTTVNQEMKGELVLDDDFKNALLLLGLDTYTDMKKAQAARQKDEIDRQLKEDLESIAVIRKKISDGDLKW